MLETLKFVRGVVAERDTVQALTHFCIYKDHIQGSNGRIHIDAPCPNIGFEAVVPAEQFLRAFDACGGDPKVRFTDSGKLVVEKKPFRAYLPNLALDLYPRADPSTGKKQKPKGPLLPTLRILRPFLGDDADRQWSATMMFLNGAALASSNAMIATRKCEVFAAAVQLPFYLIDEMLRIGDEPEFYSNDSSSITFFWGKQWLKAQLILSEWPVETARKWLAEKTKMVPIPKDLAGSVARLVPFCPNPKFPVICFDKGRLSTADGDMSAEIAGFDVGEGKFRAENLAPMLACADKIGMVEKAALFTGPDGFKGIMAKLNL